MECSNYISEKTTLEHQTRNEDNENKHSWTLRGAGRGVDLGGSGGVALHGEYMRFLGGLSRLHESPVA